jgi:sulfur carrier protein
MRFFIREMALPQKVSYPRGYGFLFFMRLKLNGQDITTGADTVESLIEELKLRPGGVAVEVNLRVLKKGEYGAYRLRENDSVEIVSFVGGG